MACEGGECKVQIFDARQKDVKVVETYARSFNLQRRNPGDKYCKPPSEDQIVAALKPRPKWLSECPKPSPHEEHPCHCVFIEDDLDPAKGWTPWVQQDVPRDEVKIPGTDGPDLPQNASCLYKLSGSFWVSSKILHGVCLEKSEGWKLPESQTKGLQQHNPAPLPVPKPPGE